MNGTPGPSITDMDELSRALESLSTPSKARVARKIMKIVEPKLILDQIASTEAFVTPAASNSLKRKYHK